EGLPIPPHRGRDRASAPWPAGGPWRPPRAVLPPASGPSRAPPASGAPAVSGDTERCTWASVWASLQIRDGSGSLGKVYPSASHSGDSETPRPARGRIPPSAPALARRADVYPAGRGPGTGGYPASRDQRGWRWLGVRRQFAVVVVLLLNAGGGIQVPGRVVASRVEIDVHDHGHFFPVGGVANHRPPPSL